MLNRGVVLEADLDVFPLDEGRYNGTVAIFPLPDLPSDKCGLKGSEFRFILNDWLLPASVSLRAVPKADLFTDANLFLSGGMEPVVLTNDDVLVGWAKYQ